MKLLSTRVDLKKHGKSVATLNSSMIQYSDKHIRRKAGFFKRLFSNLYEVTLLFEDGTEKKFTLTDLNKINSKYMKGIDENGVVHEIKTEQPFNYYVKKIY